MSSFSIEDLIEIYHIFVDNPEEFSGSTLFDKLRNHLEFTDDEFTKFYLVIRGGNYNNDIQYREYDHLY